ncbi:MAG: glycoside hydrolase family 20 zincin-like fold domain-containing protein [Pseudonocardiaceae bacterium]
MRSGRLLLVVAALVAAMAGSLAIPPAPGLSLTVRSSSAAPQLIPALRQWMPGGGDAFQWTTASRLVVDPSAATILSSTPSVLAADLQAMTGTSPAVVSGTAAAARAGDIVLTVATTATPAQPEGYALTVGPVLTVSARTGDGVFDGTRSVLQLLHQSHTNQPGNAIVIDYWIGTVTGPGHLPPLDPNAVAAHGNKVINASWHASINGTVYITLYYVLRDTPRPAPGPKYELWNTTMFDGGRTLTANLAGSQFNIWCDQPTAETEDQVADGIWPDLRV